MKTRRYGSASRWVVCAEHHRRSWNGRTEPPSVYALGGVRSGVTIAVVLAGMPVFRNQWAGQTRPGERLQSGDGLLDLIMHWRSTGPVRFATLKTKPGRRQDVHLSMSRLTTS